MPLGINPFVDPGSMDVVVIDGETCPGICELSGFSRPAEWDVKKGQGTKGATTTLAQLPPSKGSIKFFLWKQEHFDAWASSFLARFKYDPTKKTLTAVSIFHPALAWIYVNKVVTEDIGMLVHEGLGKYSIKVDLLEYLPPAPAPPVTPIPKDPVADAQQAEIARLLKLANEP